MKLLRVKEAVSKYPFSKGLLYKWHSQRRFPGLFVKVGEVLLLDEDELQLIVEDYKSQQRNQ